MRFRWPVHVLRGTLPARAQWHVRVLRLGRDSPQRTLRAGGLAVLRGGLEFWSLLSYRMAQTSAAGGCVHHPIAQHDTHCPLPFHPFLQCVGGGACEWCIEPSVCRQCREGWGLTPAGTCVVVRADRAWGWPAGCACELVSLAVHGGEGAAVLLATLPAVEARAVPVAHLPLILSIAWPHPCCSAPPTAAVLSASPPTAATSVPPPLRRPPVGAVCPSAQLPPRARPGLAPLLSECTPPPTTPAATLAGQLGTGAGEAVRASSGTGGVL